MNPVFDAHHGQLSGNGYTVPDPSSTNSDKNWIARRRVYLWDRVQEVRPPFQITTADGTHSGSTNFTLLGQAPVEVKDIKLNGATVAVTWNSVTNWSIATTLATGTNVLNVVGYGLEGAVLPTRDVGDYEDSITVFYP